MTSSNLNLDSLTSAQGFYVESKPGTSTGESVSNVGDVNGDGYPDIIVGAPNVNSYAGKAYVIYGSSSLLDIKDLDSLSVTQGFSITGTSQSSSLGYSVSGGKDINGDGCPDIIIGSPGANSNSGETYIIYGGQYLSNITNIDLGNLGAYGFYISGAPINSKSGFSVSSANINNDNYDDVIIGAPFANDNIGVTFVIYGGEYLLNITNLSNLPVEQGFSITGASINSYSGYSVSGAGDVNDDNWDDIIIGAPTCQKGPGSCSMGVSYLIYGGTSLANTVSLNLSSLTTAQGLSIIGKENSATGCSVSGAGDVNGDEIDDIIIGAYEADHGAGESYVIYGNKTQYLSNINLTNMDFQGFYVGGIYYGDYSGWSVSGAGDLNNDGYSDVIVGVPMAQGGDTFNSGKSYVIYGGESVNITSLGDLTAEQGFSVSGGYSDIYSGYSVSKAGDLNNDTYNDIIIGAPSFSIYDQFSSKSYVIYGAASGFLTPSPTAAPTFQPTFSPTAEPTYASIVPQQQTAWYDTVEFKIFYSIGGSIMGLLVPWLLREKVAFFVLNNLGHNYKFIHKDSKESIENGEVGLFLKAEKSTNAKLLFCRNSDREILVETNHGNNAGISTGLYEMLKNKLESSSSEPFTLLQSEKNQLRDFLLSRNFIKSEDLGCVRGNTYQLFLSFFKQDHSEKYRDKVRIDNNDYKNMHGSEEGEIGDSNNLRQPLLIEDGVQSSGNLPQTKWDITRESRNSYVLEAPVDAIDNLPQEVIGKKGCVLMSIDARMDPEYVRLQNKAFLEFGKQIAYITREATDSHSKLIMIEDSISSSSNIDYSSAAQFTQAAIEYASTIRYFFKLLGIDLPQVHFPNEVWAGIHFTAGMVKIGGDIASDLMGGQIIASCTYYARVQLFDMLSEAKTEEQPTDLVSFAKTCSKHIAVGSALGLASNAPIYGAINGAAMCLSQHQILEETSEQTAVRYAVDFITGTMAVYGLSDQNIFSQAIGIVSAVSMSDIATRVVMATTELGFNGVSSIFEVGDYVQ